MIETLMTLARHKKHLKNQHNKFKAIKNRKN